MSACVAFAHFRKSQERERRAIELEVSLAQAKLQALRMQINPHFLFNTLNAISTLVHTSPQTADDMIERAAHRVQDYGEVLVVTNDRAERDTVSGFGGSVSSCDNFIRMIGGVLMELQDELKIHNRTERNRFNRPR